MGRLTNCQSPPQRQHGSGFRGHSVGSGRGRSTLTACQGDTYRGRNKVDLGRQSSGNPVPSHAAQDRGPTRGAGRPTTVTCLCLLWLTRRLPN
jgi:hypothetical protein